MDPLKQFTIKYIFPMNFFGFDISYTNSALWMTIGLFGTVLLFQYSLRGKLIVPNKAQALIEISYDFISSMIRDFAGKAGERFFSFIFALFWFILMGNLLGLIPGSFTITSHIIVTFSLALFGFLTANIIGIYKHGFGFFRLFVPEGVPLVLLPLISLIELISYLVRPFSLSIRLFANMMAGHIVLKLFATFSIMLAGSDLAGMTIIPILANVFVIGLEFLVALLQTYVFTLLTCLYINDAINLH